MAQRGRGRSNGGSEQPGWEEKKREWAATRDKARTGDRLRNVAQRAERRGRDILDATRARELIRGPSSAARLVRQAGAVAKGAARLGLTAALMSFVAWRMWRRRAA